MVSVAPCAQCDSRPCWQPVAGRCRLLACLVNLCVWGKVHLPHPAVCLSHSLRVATGTSLTMHYAMDDANDVLVAYKQVRVRVC